MIKKNLFATAKAAEEMALSGQNSECANTDDHQDIPFCKECRNQELERWRGVVDVANQILYGDSGGTEPVRGKGVWENVPANLLGEYEKEKMRAWAWPD